MTTEPATTCPSTLTLDRHLVGELTTSEAHALESHLAGCASCHGRWTELAQFNADFAEPCPPFPHLTTHTAVARPSPSGSALRKKVAVWASFVSAAGAFAAMFFLWFLPSKPVEEVRTKGGARLTYHVSRGGTVWLAGPNEELHENDAIQFVFSATEPGYLAVFSVDGRGLVSSYYPAAGEVAAAYQPEHLRLSTSTVLDGTLGEEVFVAVFCSHSFEKREVAESLDKVKATPEQLRFSDCSVQVLRAKKVEP